MISTRLVRYVVVSSFVGVAVLAIVILSAIAVHQLLSAEPETAAISSLSNNDETADSTVPGRVSDSESQQSSVSALQQHPLTSSVSADASSWSPLSFGAPNAGNVELTSGDVAPGNDSADGTTGANGGGGPAAGAGFPQASGGGGGVASAGGFVGTAGVFAGSAGGGGGFAGSAGAGSVMRSVAAPASVAVAPPASQDPSSAPASVTPPVSTAPSAPAASNPPATAATPQAAPAIAATPQPASSSPAGPQPASSLPAAAQPAGPVAEPAKNQAPENFAWTADTILQTPKPETNGGQKTSATLAAEADTLDTGIASVPSPSSLLLTALGLVLVVWYIRRRDLRSQ